jgi:hypothetical protein
MSGIYVKVEDWFDYTIEEVGTGFLLKMCGRCVEG